MPASDVPLNALIPSWELSLDGASKSPRTITSYLDSVRRLTAWLIEQGLPYGAETTDAPGIRAFLAAERERTSAASAAVHFRNLRVFFGWLDGEGERKAPNPMRRVDEPAVARKVKPMLSLDDQGALLKVCQGARFEDKRDTAIVRIFIDTGVRVSGMAGMQLTDVKLAERRIKVTLKGGEEIWIPLGKKSAAAVDRYLRARGRHPRAASPWLWLGTQGHDTSHLAVSGITAMLKRRGRRAGLGDQLGPHWFRRTFAHRWLEVGGTELDLMRITGWRTRAMIEVYAGELAAERARQAHARLSPGDMV